MLGFYNTLDQIPDFAASEYTRGDVPDTDIEQATLLLFFSRETTPDVQTVLDFVTFRTQLSPSTEEVAAALDTLDDRDLINRDSDGYRLNLDNSLAAVLQDAYIEYTLHDKY